MTEGYAANWTMDQLRDSAQKVANRINAPISAAMPAPETLRSTGFWLTDTDVSQLVRP